MNRGLMGHTRPLLPRRLRQLEAVTPPDHPDAPVLRQGPAAADLGGGRIDHFDRHRPLNWTYSLTNVAAWDINRTWKSHLYFRFSAASGSLGLILPWKPTGDFSVTAKIRHMMQGNADQTLLSARTADEQDIVFAKWVGRSNTADATFNMLVRNAGGYTDEGNVPFLMNSLAYLHLQRVGTNWSTWFSTDGYGFQRSHVRSKTMTVDKIVVEFSTAASSFAGKEAGVDWVRLNWKIF